jgi:galactokinase
MTNTAWGKIVAHAPGRVELLGNHTDYNEGVVLGAAIDRRLTVRGKQREDGMIVIHSDTMGEIQIHHSGLRPLARGHWANYALGVVAELAALSVPIAGFTAEVSGDLLPQSGLSSSAAFTVAIALFLLKLHDHEIGRMEIAKLCQRAEHRYAGVQSGLLDQVTSLFGRADHAVFFDCRSEEVSLLRFPKDLALIIANSGEKRDLTEGGYNQRRDETRAAAGALEVTALRDITVAELAQRRSLPELLRRRAAHVAEENERVWRGRALLEAGNGAALGALMNASHKSSRENFENSTPGLDLLVSVAQELPGVLGARLTGAGFGGGTVTLCKRSCAEAAASELSRRYLAATGIDPRAFIARIDDGAQAER